MKNLKMDDIYEYLEFLKNIRKQVRSFKGKIKVKVPKGLVNAVSQSSNGDEIALIIIKNKNRLKRWDREINIWLKKLQTADNFLNEYREACSSYDWKQICIEYAMERWPSYQDKIEKLKGTC